MRLRQSYASNHTDIPSAGRARRRDGTVAIRRREPEKVIWYVAVEETLKFSF